LVAAPDLGSGAARRGGSSPFIRTRKSGSIRAFFVFIDMFYVYILQSEVNGAYYKGFTSDIRRRLSEHNSGKEKSTSRYVPWQLVWYAEKPTREEAMLLEKKLKNITSKEKLKTFIKKYS
jgi:putative endonuclease